MFYVFHIFPAFFRCCTGLVSSFQFFSFFSFIFFYFFAAIDRMILRPHAMSQLHHGMGTLRAKDRRTTHTTGKMTQHSTDTPIRTETTDRHIPAHVQRKAAKLIRRAMHLIRRAMNYTCNELKTEIVRKRFGIKTAGLQQTTDK